ncbi:MAG: hypothetical protein HY938_05520 [Nitrosomonadales bacterium]|nr:hypothetical protein [Nitrosomonadales bacterium]
MALSAPCSLSAIDGQSEMISMQPKGKVLLFSYAFPPMQVQMTPAVFKPMAAIAHLGYQVDVVCADSFSPHLPLDNSLLPYAEQTFSDIYRLNPPKGLVGFLKGRSNVLSRVPDLMAVLHKSAYQHLMDLDLSQYEAVMTWSPFHSINPVMVRVKKARGNVKWIAQFSDPWAGNPLETNIIKKAWNNWREPQTVNAADFIVHCSRYSLDLMLRNHPEGIRSKTDVLPHVFNEVLYPQRPKFKNNRVVLRYLGVLFGRRSPEPLFQALKKLLDRRKDLSGALQVELVGSVPAEMLNTLAALSLPKGTVTTFPSVSYIQSLALMYDADVLLLIEADVRQNLFLPSKLSDYIGANTPIVGLVPPGASEDALKGLGSWYAKPTDIEGIARAVENAVDHVMKRPSSPWCNEEYRQTMNGKQVGSRYIEIIKGLA